MERPAKQEGFTLNGASKTPILAHEKGHTVVRSKQSPKNTSTASNNSLSDRPLTPAEALSLLQTRCSDLQLQGLNVEILADAGDLFISVRYQGHALGFNGHILLDGQPVVKG